MSEYVKQPVFLDQIQVGDRFSIYGKQPFTVTGRRVEEYGDKTVYTLIGLDDAGGPASQQGVGSIPVIRYAIVPAEEQT